MVLCCITELHKVLLNDTMLFSVYLYKIAFFETAITRKVTNTKP